MLVFSEREVIILLIITIIMLVIKLEEEKILTMIKNSIDKIKNEDSIKSFINLSSKYFSKIWYIILLSVVSYNNYFIFSNDDEIMPLTKGSILFILNIILLFLPLVSEIEISGIKIKKQVEALQKDLDDKFFHLNTMIFNNSNSNNNYINIGLMSKEELEEDLSKIKDSSQNFYTNEENNNSNDLNKNNSLALNDDIYTDIYKQVGYMANTRRNIELKLKDIADLSNINLDDRNRQFTPIIRFLDLLTRREIINLNLSRTIRQVIAICNRSIHGEIVDKEYINYVIDAEKYILNNLDRIKDDRKFR